MRLRGQRAGSGSTVERSAARWRRTATGTVHRVVAGRSRPPGAGQRNFVFSAASTRSGTVPVSGPPKRATSFTSELER
jgi:hypothetical protein